MKYGFILFVISLAAAVIQGGETEGPKGDYLPPISAIKPSNKYITPEENEALTKDGYRYKTVKKLKYRHRRDVSSGNLTPAETVTSTSVGEYLPPSPDTELTNDGYSYKEATKLKYKKRRDISELVPNDYLPPVAEVVQTAKPEVKTDLADDGYVYKTVRRLKYRSRRDVGEVLSQSKNPTKNYLPPSTDVSAEVVTNIPSSEDDKSAIIAKDGYHYKVIRRLKYRQRV